MLERLQWNNTWVSKPWSNQELVNKPFAKKPAAMGQNSSCPLCFVRPYSFSVHLFTVESEKYDFTQIQELYVCPFPILFPKHSTPKCFFEGHPVEEVGGFAVVIRQLCLKPTAANQWGSEPNCCSSTAVKEKACFPPTYWPGPPLLNYGAQLGTVPCTHR